VGVMRLISNGKICAVNAREQARQQKWQSAQKRKQKGGKKNG
jgi:hypothetical protein